MRTALDLAEKQALPLDLKIALTQQRIREWVREYGTDGCVISFSGGKDSTVLLHLVRELYPDVRAVFSNTGLEYPEIQRFVKSFDNVDIVTPKMHFNEVISTYGYPLISKEVAEAIYYARRIRSQDVNVERERERTEQASSSTREQSYTERERQDTQGQKVPHGEIYFKRIEIGGGESEAYPDERLRDAENASQREVPSGTPTVQQREMGTEVSQRSRGNRESDRRRADISGQRGKWENYPRRCLQPDEANPEDKDRFWNKPKSTEWSDWRRGCL